MPGHIGLLQTAGRLENTMTEKGKTVIVIGAGAAGLVAAGRAAETAEKVILIEKNDILGKKLRITGKGRCNITNAADTEDMIAMYPTNGKFLYSALYTFTNNDIISLIESFGVPTKVERGGRIFPVTDKASDVAAALSEYALKKNTRLIRARAEDIIIKNGCAAGVMTDKGAVYGGSVIICTGGKSYPGTGSTGDGYAFAEKTGHRLVPVKPSLVPVETEEKWTADVMGLSLKNVSLTVYGKGNKKIYEDFGEMLFTHFGISGPIVLSASAHMQKRGEYWFSIDLKPALTFEKLDARLVRDLEKHGKKHILNSLGELLPKALIPVAISLSGIDPHKQACDITRAERHALAETLKNMRLTFKRFRPIEEAIITSGGVSVKDIDPSTMQSKKIKGLYFAGEVIDIDGYTGGYNLQAAFSTGYLAGMNAAADDN